MRWNQTGRRWNEQTRTSASSSRFRMFVNAARNGALGKKWWQIWEQRLLSLLFCALALFPGRKNTFASLPTTSTHKTWNLKGDDPLPVQEVGGEPEELSALQVWLTSLDPTAVFSFSASSGTRQAVPRLRGVPKFNKEKIRFWREHHLFSSHGSHGLI